jgi:hypothetical protein
MGARCTRQPSYVHLQPFSFFSLAIPVHSLHPFTRQLVLHPVIVFEHSMELIDRGHEMMSNLATQSHCYEGNLRIKQRIAAYLRIYDVSERIKLDQTLN